MIFINRQHAGRLLGEKILHYKNQSPIILALPRGGVPVALEVAVLLQAPLEVLVVRKIGHPLQQELAVGALCEGDEPLWNEQLLSRTGLEPDDLNRIVLQETQNMKQQIADFRGGRKLLPVGRKTIVIVDDGLATGATVAAAIKYLRKNGAAKIIVAVPVAAEDSARQIRNKVDDLVTIEEPKDLESVGLWYQDFSEVSNGEVIRMLKANKVKNDMGRNA